MNKVYCQHCLAEIPDYAHFCHLCGAEQTALPGDSVHNNTPPPASAEGFNTEFAPASAGRPHSEDATLLSDNVLLQSYPTEVPHNLATQATAGDSPSLFPETPPRISSVKIPDIRQSGDTAPISGEYNDVYYMVRNRDVDELAAHPTNALKKDEDEDDVLLLPPVGFNMPPPRAEHVQPQMLRAEHMQPQMARANHFQPQLLRAEHHQPLLIHATHRQPASSRTFFATHQRTIRYLLLATSSVLLVGIIVLLTIPLFRTGAQVNNPQATAVLAAVNASSVFPGGSVTLHGTNFTPGATVTFTTDGDELAQDGGQRLTTFVSLASATTSAFAQGAYLDTTVQANGTFDIIILVPQTWQAGSTHKIQATEVNSGKTASVEVAVYAQPVPTPHQVKPTPQPDQHPTQPSTTDQNPGPRPVAVQQPTPATTSNQQPPPEPGSTGPALRPFCLSSDEDTLSFSATVRGDKPDDQIVSLRNGTGCEAGDWSASSDASWLDIGSHKGHLASGKTTLISIGTEASHLNPGSYTGHIKLYPGSTSITVYLNVELAPTCISANVDRISFILNAHTREGGWAVDQASDRTVTIENGDDCRDGRWTVSSDAKWLSASPHDGKIDRGGSSDAKVHVLADDLSPDRLYTGHLTFKAGSSKAIITVYLKVVRQLSPVCLTSRTSTLNFTSQLRLTSDGDYAASQPADQKVTIDNGRDCGEGDWKVTSDAHWLLVNGGGHIRTGGSADSNVHIALAGLDLTKSPQIGHLTFSSDGSKPVVVTVYLYFKQVTPAVTPSPVTCEGIVTRPDTLTFTSSVKVPTDGGWSMYSRPADQSSTITAGKDCPPADWTVSSDENWLTVKGGGHIEPGGTGNATAHVNLDGLDASKTYTGHLNFQSGSNKATVTVNLRFVKIPSQVTPEPTHIVPTPVPTYAVPTPEPTHVVPTPIPTHVVPTPVPTYAVPTPVPTHVVPTPIPTYAVPTPVPTHVVPTPIPTHVVVPTPVPTPIPTHVVPTPVPVKPTPVPVVLTQCIRANPSGLGFSGDNGYNGYNPRPQTIAVSNCGSGGTISAAASNESSGWLFAAGGGQVGPGGVTYINVSVDGIKSGLAPGTHAGTVYITIRTSDGNTKNIAVGVTFNLAHSNQPAPQPTSPPPPQPTPTSPPQPTPQAQPTQAQPTQPSDGQSTPPKRHGQATPQNQ